MSNIIEEWRVREFEKSVYIKAQQGDSRLFGNAIQGTQHSKLKSYDILGSTDVQDRVERYGDTPNLELPHSRRSVVLKDYDWGKLIDDADVLRTLNDPTNPYVEVMSKAFMRKQDKVFIERALGAALEGEDAGSSVALPTTQKIAAVKSSALAGLNLDTLRAAKYHFDSAEVDPEEIRFLAVTAKQVQDLLKLTEVTSHDYNTVKALVDGKVDTFMGFKFVLCNLLSLEAAATKYSLTTGEYDNSGGTSAAGGRQCIAWVKSGMRMMTGKGLSVKVNERADKKNIPQIYGWMSIGGVRMEDVKVLEINCKEA